MPYDSPDQPRYSSLRVLQQRETEPLILYPVTLGFLFPTLIFFIIGDVRGKADWIGVSLVITKVATNYVTHVVLGLGIPRGRMFGPIVDRLGLCIRHEDQHRE